VNFAIFSAHATGVDPYAKSIGRLVRWDDSVFGYTIGDPDGDLSFDTRDNAAYATLAAVIDPAFTGGDDRPPRTPWHKTVIYEMHVRGFTKLHPNVPEPLRDAYEALTREAAIEHPQRLGVTAVELMPVHHHAYDRHLVERGLPNYWGYNTQAFFAPNIRYSASGHADDSVREFKRMVKALHSAGLEVILDVVYNHTRRETTWARRAARTRISGCVSSTPSKQVLPKRASSAGPRIRCRDEPSYCSGSRHIARIAVHSITRRESGWRSR
jgi:glycogen operon protein